MSGGGGGTIIRKAVINAATLDTVSENLTPAECGERDTICAKHDADITRKDLKDLFKLIDRAYGRVA